METAQVALLISFFGYVLYGAAGFGAAMIFHSIWSILEMFEITNGSVAEATFFLNIMTLVVTILMTINNRKLIQWDFVAACILPWFTMNVLGSIALTNVPNEPLKFGLGLVLVGIFIQQTYKTVTALLTKEMLREKIDDAQKSTSQEDDFEDEIPFVNIREKWMWVLFAGIFGGTLSGLFNMPGPATIIVLLFSGIHRERWKANFFAWQIPAQIFVCYYLAIPGGLYDPKMNIYYLGMACVSMTASKLGNALSKSLDKTTFTLIVIALSAMGAVSNLKVYLPREIQGPLMVGALVFSLFIIGGLFWMLNKHVNEPFKEYMEVNYGLLDNIAMLENEIVRKEAYTNYSPTEDIVA